MSSIVGIILLATGLIIGIVGMLAAAQKLPGNSVIGLRLQEVRKDKDTWNKAHQVAGPFWLLSGLATLFAGAISFRTDGFGWIVPVILLVIALFFIGIGANYGARRAAIIDVSRETTEESTPSSPAVDLDALRSAARNIDK